MRTPVACALAAGVGLAFLCVGAGAVTFDPNIVTGDRRVELHWAPDDDDPVFTGNLSIYPLGADSVSSSEITFLSFARAGAELWFWDALPRQFVRLTVCDDSAVVEQVLDPLPESVDVEVLSHAAHPEGVMLLAGLADGRIAAWRPADSLNAEIFQAHAEGQGCLGLAFKPLATELVTPFVSVGEDGFWKYWSAPSSLESEVHADSTQPLTSVAITRRGGKVAVGNDQGRIRIYELGSSDTSPLRVIDGHEGRLITGLSFSEGEDRLASADEDGGVRIWNTVTGYQIGGSDREEPDRISIIFTPRPSSYVSYCLAGGTIGLIDGYTGRSYAVSQDLGHRVTAFTLSPNGFSGYLGGADGMLEWWYQGLCIPSPETPECFGGYRILRGMYPVDDEDSEELARLRVYDFGDSTWAWTPSDSTRTFVDPDSVIRRGGDLTRPVAGPHNGTPYYYSIQKYYWQFLDGDVFATPLNSTFDGFYRADGDPDPTPVIPRVEAVAVPPLLDDVYVVPNPYLEYEDTCRFGPLSPPLIRFFNLPEEATIRIYTTSGELVQTLHHVQDPGGLSGGSCPWDLKNEYGRYVVSGVYLFAAETPGGETTRGFFTIVR